ncbi:MAG TPA: hypothetical protein VMF08_09320 [Candidatus Sulfotelmatobacter sp.]|nr:hypothetical protein [Candidatus Sulfotelmatobacter sp.]
MADYVFLCEHLFKPLPLQGETQIRLPPAMIEFSLQQEQNELAEISGRAERLAPIAGQFSGLISRAEYFQQHAPRLSPIVFNSAVAVLGLYTGQGEIAGAGGVKALNATESVWDAVNKEEELFNDRDILAVRLAHLAKTFSAPIGESGLVDCSFKDETPAFLQSRTRHSLTLTNSSGRELHNCVVAVFFSNARGDSCLNFYFVPEWQIGETRVANYSDALDFPKDTVNKITEVDIGFFSKDCSIEPFAIKRPSGGWPTAS